MSVYSCLVPSLAQTGIHWGRNVLVTTVWLRQWYSWHTAAAQWVNRCWMNREIKVACRQTGCLVIGVNKWWESRQSWKGKLESNSTGASVCWLLRRPFNLFQDKFPARKLSSFLLSFLIPSYLGVSYSVSIYKLKIPSLQLHSTCWFSGSHPIFTRGHLLECSKVLLIHMFKTVWIYFLLSPRLNLLLSMFPIIVTQDLLKYPNLKLEVQSQK